MLLQTLLFRDTLGNYAEPPQEALMLQEPVNG